MLAGALAAGITVSAIHVVHALATPAALVVAAPVPATSEELSLSSHAIAYEPAPLR